jgi:ABC-type molybdate transport system ATPase subunit
MIKAKITKIINGNGGVIDVHLNVDRFQIVSRITAEARRDLRLE